MKNVIVVVTIVCQLVAGRPQNAPTEQDKDAQILKYESAIHRFSSQREGEDSSKALKQKHTSQLKSTDSGATVVKMEGLFSLITPDNTIYELQYISDENGYRPRVSIRTPGFVKVPIIKTIHIPAAVKPFVSSTNFNQKSATIKPFVSNINVNRNLAAIQPFVSRETLNRNFAAVKPFFSSTNFSPVAVQPKVTSSNLNYNRPKIADAKVENAYSFQPVVAKKVDKLQINKQTKEDNKAAIPSFPGGYKAGSNGVIQVQKAADNGKAITAVNGHFSFVAPNNITYEVHYTSDENGYRPRISIKSPDTEPVVYDLPVLSEKDKSEENNDDKPEENKDPKPEENNDDKPEENNDSKSKENSDDKSEENIGDKSEKSNDDKSEENNADKPDENNDPKSEENNDDKSKENIDDKSEKSNDYKSVENNDDKSKENNDDKSEENDDDKIKRIDEVQTGQ